MVPRRSPDPLALAIGQRIRHLRHEHGLTLEKLAYESDFGSKGNLSWAERGLHLPSATKLKLLADRLGVHLLDLMTFPEEDERQRLVDLTRGLTRGSVKKLIKELSQPLKAGRKR
jgi:transcriptional regulator with XRE-family HTH domain